MAHYILTNKTKGFSTIELIITMVIGSIVITIASLTYVNLSKISEDKKELNNNAIKFLNCAVIIKDKTFFAKNIKTNFQGSIFFYGVNDSTTLKQIDRSSLIIENKSRADTFRFDQYSLKIETINKTDFVKHITFHVSVDGINYAFNFCKNYDSSFLYNLNQHNNAY